MNVEQMKKRKIELGYSYEMISSLSGVPLGTVQKIFSGATKAPRYDTLKALERIFTKDADPVESAGIIREDTAPYTYGNHSKDGGAVPGILRDPSAGYAVKSDADTAPTKKKQGEYTIEDYFALPDERRVELINGVFYDMASPTSTHQAISAYLSFVFFSFIKEHGGKCHVFTAPLDVQLNKDNKTMVQPDLLVICDSEKYKKGIIYGAPELAIEILSDSTRGKDLVLKLNKYCEAGVTEYWTVDPRSKEITVFTFHEEIESAIYACGQDVPVGIWNNECVVHTADLFEYISFTEES